MYNLLKKYKYLILFIIIIGVFIFTKNVLKNIKVSKYESQPEYTVKEFDDFLTDTECNTIISLAKPNLFESKIYSNDNDNVDKKHRISMQNWLKDSEHPVIEALSKKVAQITNTPLENQEWLQVVRYKPGGFFNNHYDACDGTKSFCERMDGKSGPRLATLIIYLNDDFEGGQTNFPKINKLVVPKKGKAVLFYNINPKSHKIIEQALHSGTAVTQGEKWICNKWIRINKFVN